ncbi:MAG: tRNA preQ1(34) S-adenosylmethionine ribosyltransferase-isomerase QueA, partial [Rhizobiales bacterium]|nr:tRNA preQ1(34) S-adenosylmethionine ribosyltransferase-isomerase QueA [Hyphomicrobiales bacterium]
MNVDLFDFELPDSRIALRPATPRDSARMLVVEPAQWLDRTIADLAGFLRAGDVVVANDTKVIPARLVGVRVRDGNQARMTVTLHKREGLDRWRAFVKPAKKLHLNETVLFDPARTEDGLSARVVEKADGGEVVFVFNRSGAALDSAIAQWGSMPLPPYIATHRAEDDADRHDYQTLFAAHEGAVAAPTAGLHFTSAVRAAIEQCGASVITVTLHVGAGTFLPVKADDTNDHRMHSEWG